jgi:hypothetical protein
MHGLNREFCAAMHDGGYDVVNLDGPRVEDVGVNVHALYVPHDHERGPALAAQAGEPRWTLITRSIRPYVKLPLAAPGLPQCRCYATPRYAGLARAVEDPAAIAASFSGRALSAIAVRPSC